MKTVKIILVFLIIITTLFFTTGLIIKENTHSIHMTIHKPLEETFSLFNDLSTIPKWNPEYISIDVIDKKTGFTGSVYRIKIQHNEEEVFIKEKILAYVKNEKVTLFFDREGLIETDDFYFYSDGSSTTIKLHSNYQAKSYILGCVLPYFRYKFKQIDKKALLNFKNFAENTTF